ncbi:MAG: hypothetical protein ABIE74_11605 [Pseudomonadota bacterium]
MKRRSAITILAVVLCILFLASDSFAKKGEKGKPQKSNQSYSKQESTSTPPGWSKGKKTGWGNKGYPPGYSKWNKEKKSKWDKNRVEAHDDIDGYLVRYRFNVKQRDEIQEAFEEAIVGGILINDAKDKIVDAMQDPNKRKRLMINTMQTALELMK